MTSFYRKKESALFLKKKNATTSSGRSDDLTGILKLINEADEFINIAVGEYIPKDVYKGGEKWTVIDNALRKGSHLLSLHYVDRNGRANRKQLHNTASSLFKRLCVVTASRDRGVQIRFLLNDEATRRKEMEKAVKSLMRTKDGANITAKFIGVSISTLIGC